MKNVLNLAISGLLFGSLPATGAISNATARSELSTSGGQSANLSATSLDFGASYILDETDSAYSSVGGDQNGLPYAMVSAYGNNLSKGNQVSAFATLTYHWKITAIGAQPVELVPVRITSNGFIRSTYSLLPEDLSKNRTYPTWNPVIAQASAHIRYHQSNYYDTYIGFGLNYGSGVKNHPGQEFFLEHPNWGQDPLNEYFGGVRENYSTFSKSVDIMVLPSNENEISLISHVGFNHYGLVIDQNVRQKFEAHSFVDPVIEIDSAFKDRYRLEISEIPVAAIPEPDVLNMVIAGLASLIVVNTFRRKSIYKSSLCAMAT